MNGSKNLFTTSSANDFSEVTHVVNPNKVVRRFMSTNFVKLDCVAEWESKGWTVTGSANGFGCVPMEKEEVEFETRVFKTKRAAEKFMEDNHEM